MNFRKKIEFIRKRVIQYWSEDGIAFERRLLGKGLAYGFLSLLVFGSLIYLYGG